MKRRLGIHLSLTVLVLLSACLLLPAAAEQEFACEITMSPMQVNAGEPVTATWTLTGGSPPYTLTCNWVETDGSGVWVTHPEADTDGTASFTPANGGWLSFSIEVEDSQRKWGYFTSKSVLIHGPEEEPVTYTPEMLNAKVDEVAAACIAAASGEYARAKWLNEWLVNNANYDYSFTYYGADGVMLAGKGVCNSFALAYRLLLNKVGIGNLVVGGSGLNDTGWGGHAWNLVRIGGNWYHVDVTWNDGVGVNHYFLKSDQTMAKDHNWDTSRYPAAPADWGKAPDVKGTYDMTLVDWDYSKPLLFDGSEKTITLTGLPLGLKAIYSGNTATQVGTYTASVTFEYDSIYYEEPVMPELVWEIRKETFDLSQARWQYNGAFAMDGTEKTVTLTGLPEGLTPIYTGNTATLPGTYVASVAFDVDETYYEMPVIPDLEWTISKKVFDLWYTEWNYWGEFHYDGTEKTVELIGLPEGLTPIYAGNTASEVGNYTATVTFQYDAQVYEAPEIPPLNWAIIQGDGMIDLRNIRWDYSSPFTYDGTEKTVTLSNVPFFLTAVYTGNTATEPGTYTASVTLEMNGSAFGLFEIEDLQWVIETSAAEPTDPPTGAGLPGDATNDGQVDILDLVSIIDYIVSGIKPLSPGNADANNDTAIDILDLVWIINYIVGG